MSAVFRSSWERLLGKTDSPIEGEFLDNFCALAVQNGYEVASKSRAVEGVILVKPQAPFGERYRADFLIRYPFLGEEYACVVECDGHEFHDRTKEQAVRDRRRDRVCQRLNYQIFRFTGSEIRGSPNECGFEVLEAIMDWQTQQCVEATTPVEPEELIEAAE